MNISFSAFQPSQNEDANFFLAENAPNASTMLISKESDSNNLEDDTIREMTNEKDTT